MKTIENKDELIVRAAAEADRLLAETHKLADMPDGPERSGIYDGLLRDIHNLDRFVFLTPATSVPALAAKLRRLMCPELGMPTSGKKTDGLAVRTLLAGLERHAVDELAGGLSAEYLAAISRFADYVSGDASEEDVSSEPMFNAEARILRAPLSSAAMLALKLQALFNLADREPSTCEDLDDGFLDCLRACRDAASAFAGLPIVDEHAAVAGAMVERRAPFTYAIAAE